ncbi:MAG: hypothetical protein BECKG1743D_GA0114223_111971 [Candidatus Kentron sp. G]|nr:MAG: hypothetical protein BECKG1743D_GA0114223_111971 [Candidatus Kentron sp. G]
MHFCIQLEGDQQKKMVTFWPPARGNQVKYEEEGGWYDE